MTDNMYVTDGLENGIDNLEMLNSFLQPPMSGSKWKWSTIAAHQALYSFLIAALQGTAPILNVAEGDHRKKRDGKKMTARMKYLRGGSISDIAHSLGVQEQDVIKWLASPQLISIGEALRRVKDKQFLHWMNSEPLVTSMHEDEAISLLVWEYRNNFEHFIPKTWVIYTADFPDMFKHVMRVIRFIAIESNTIFIYDNEQKERIRQVLNSIDRKLQSHNSNSGEC
jgi:hypothetical protein